MSLRKPPDGGPGDKAALEKVQKRMEDRAVGMALEQIFEPKHQLVQRKWFVRCEKNKDVLSLVCIRCSCFFRLCGNFLKNSALDAF